MFERENQEILQKNDNELVELVYENQENFIHIINRYEKQLLAYIIRISGVSQEEAEDILQDVFIKVYKNINSFDSDLKFSSWIYRITHNQVISNYRKNKARPNCVSLTDDGELINKLASDLDIVKEVDQEILKQKLKNLIEEMDIRYRDVLILRFFEEKDYQEISDILKKPMGTVATLINRAKKQLQGQIIDLNI